MYHRLCLNLYERSLYRISSGVRFQFSRLNHIASKDEAQRNVETVLTKFPDYKIIYSFPYIKYMGNINRMKQRFTILLGATLPATVCLQLTGILSFDTAASLTMTGFLFVMWLHTLGIYCNNLVGYVYMREDEENIILSYVNYWGKRIDLEVTVREVIPISDNPFRPTDILFKTMRFSSRKEKLKIDMRFGQITHDSFKYVVGAV